MMNKKALLALTLSLVLAIASVGCGAKDTVKENDEKNDTVVSNEIKDETLDEDKLDVDTDSTDSTETTDSDDATTDTKDDENKDETKKNDASNSTASSDKGTSDKKEQTSSSNKNESSNSNPGGNKNETQKPSSSNGNSNSSNTNTSTGQNKPSGNTGTSKPNTDTNKPSNNNSSSGNSNTGTTKPQEPSKPVHTHNWTEVTQTITHEEKGHYETQVVKEAWVEEHYDWRTICGKCKTDLTDMNTDDFTIHVALICGGGYSTHYIKVGETPHSAETKEVWVVDQPASTETVVIGYKCSCGATKEK